MKLTPKAIERFWAKVEKTEGSCWLWKGSYFHFGHGQFHANGTALLAHRVAYFLETGDDPKERCVCHTCDNPPCVNPAHLWLGTRQQNMKDRDSKGRVASGDRSGRRKHPEAWKRVPA